MVTLGRLPGQTQNVRIKLSTLANLLRQKIQMKIIFLSIILIRKRILVPKQVFQNTRFRVQFLREKSLHATSNQV